MIESLNHLSQFWVDIIVTATLQNSVYLLLVMSILYLFRDRNAKILRIIALFGLLKLFVLPLISSSFVQELNIPTLTDFSLMTIIDSTQLIDNTVTMTSQSKLMILWSSIAIFILLFSAFNTYRFRSKFRHAVLTNIDDFYSEPIQKNIKFYTSTQNHSPIVFGLFKIKIILPGNWKEWSVHQKRTVIVHELNHINQLDHWINIFKLIAFSIHFFNPFVWILLKKLNDLNELACDDSTIASIRTSTIDYTKQLVHFSESYANSSIPILSTLTFTESYKSLKRRLSYHLSKKEGIMMNNDNLIKKITITICIIAMIPLLGQCSKEEPVSTLNADGNDASSEISESKDMTYSYDQLSVKPEITHKEMPGYPEEARKEGISGKVVVKVTINEVGDVIEATIFSSDNSVLDKAALEAAKKCKFKPAEMNGQKVKVSFNLPYKFALK